MQKNSASQINTFDDCERKWGWRIIAGEPDDFSGAAALLGTEVDDTQLQPYLRDGRPFDLTRESGLIALSALEWLPEPKSPGLEVQKHFVLASAEGDWGYQGYMDLWLPDAGVLKYLPQTGGWPAVVDFKTTSDFKWAKTEETLKVDNQAQLYAMDAMVESGARTVDLVWIYMRTRGARRSKAVHVRVDSGHVGEQFDRIEAASARMFAHRDAARGNDGHKYVLEVLKPNAAVCDKFGGCPYQHLCNLSPKTKSAFAGVLERKVTGMSLMANLRKKAAEQDAAAGVMGMSDKDVPAPAGPTAFDAPAAVAAPVMAGINPPEKDLPPADPVGIASAKPKRGRPAGSKNKTEPDGAALVAAMEANAQPQPPVAQSGGIDFPSIAQSFLALSVIFENLSKKFSSKEAA